MPFGVYVLRTVPQEPRGIWKQRESRNHCWYRLEYWDESWKSKETCCYSEPVKDHRLTLVWKTYKEWNNNNNNYNNNCQNFWDEACWFFIIKGFRTIVFIFIVISTTFRPICPPAFFRCLSNSGTFTELRTTSFIESTGVAHSDCLSHNWVKMLSIPVLLLVCSQDWTCNLQVIVSEEA